MIIQNTCKENTIEANIKKDKELLEQALNELRGMRDTWKEVMAKAKQG